MVLDHVALTVRDRAASAAFYATHFGLDVEVHRDDHLLILGSRHGDHLLALSQGEAPSGASPHQPLRLPRRVTGRGARRP